MPLVLLMILGSTVAWWIVFGKSTKQEIGTIKRVFVQKGVAKGITEATHSFKESCHPSDIKTTVGSNIALCALLLVVFLLPILFFGFLIYFFELYKY